MKTTLQKLAILFLIVTGPVIASACEIDIEILENKKEIYHKGDVLIVKVKVILTHRQCPEGINTTKFSYEGIKVLGATKWNEISKGTFERKFNLVFGALRTCDKEGGAGSIKFTVE
jgi:hypothetical protein